MATSTTCSAGKVISHSSHRGGINGEKSLPPIASQTGWLSRSVMCILQGLKGTYAPRLFSPATGALKSGRGRVRISRQSQAPSPIGRILYPSTGARMRLRLPEDESCCPTRSSSSSLMLLGPQRFCQPRLVRPSRYRADRHTLRPWRTIAPLTNVLMSVRRLVALS